MCRAAVVLAIGAVPGLGGLTAKVTSKGIVHAARAGGAYSRGTGKVGRMIANRTDAFGEMIYGPLQYASGTRALWCAGVI